MRGGRSFLILLVAALGLGAYIYFVESKREPAGASVVRGEKVFDIEPGTIEEVTIRTTSGETTTVRKSGDAWQIAAPAALDADTSAVGSLVSSLESLESDRTVDENPASVAPYGLDPPRLSVAFKVAGETTARQLVIGERTPTGSDLYARVEGSARLILIASYIEDSLNKSLFDLRDKSVLKFGRDAVDAIAIRAADAPPVTLARSGDDWRIGAPIGAAADFSTVDGLVGRLFQARMQAIVSPKDPVAATEPTAADLRSYGLDRPAVVVELGSGSTRATLAIGSTHEASTRYARDLSRPLVFTVESSLFDDLTKKPDDLRSKDIFAFRSFTAAGIDVAAGGRTVTFTKEKAPAPADATATPADVWKQTAPEARDVDQTKLTDMLTTLSNLRAESFASQAQAGGDETAVTARFGDAASLTTERVVFRRLGDVVHAVREGEPGAAVVSTADFDRAIALLKELTGAGGQ